ncbi:MAG: hypothetical protein M1833_002880 [Piccolia ochrophora]|nr:MAG: hypothetical protein M1833_002880 [Piccolia ochrophora]
MPIAPHLRSIATAGSKTGRATQQQTRNLHITLPAPTPRPWLGADLRSKLYQPIAFGELKSECQRRNLSTSGTKDELIDQLIAADLLQNSSFTTAAAASNGPVVPQSRNFSQTPIVPRTPGPSPIDHFYFPSATDENVSSLPPRLPLLPDAPTTHADHVSDGPVLRGEIHTIAHPSTHAHGVPSAMSEVADNATAELDVYTLTETVGRAAGRNGGDEKQGGLREVWRGFVEDLLDEGQRLRAA